MVDVKCFLSALKISWLKIKYCVMMGNKKQSNPFDIVSIACRYEREGRRICKCVDAKSW